MDHQRDRACFESRVPLARCPEVNGPHTTVYNRFNRWSVAGIWQKMLEAQCNLGPADRRVSTVQPPRHTAARRAQKGSPGAGDWSQPRRANDQDPRRRQRLQAFDRVRTHRDVRSAKRLIDKPSTAALVLADTAYDSDKFRKFVTERGSTAATQSDPQEHSAVRQDCLQKGAREGCFA
jgi:transposase